MQAESTEYVADLHVFAQGGRVEAEAAFSRLWRRVEDPLFGFLRRSGVDPTDCEDTIQTASIHVWRARPNFRVYSPGGWWSFVKKTATNCLVDEVRKRPTLSNVRIEDAGELPEEDVPYVDALALAAENMRSLSRSADSLWLGKSEEPVEDDLKLLAAQFFYLHDMPAAGVAKLLAINDLRKLDSWLSDASVIRRLAYHALFRSNDALAGEILRPEKPYTPRELDGLMRDAYDESGMPPEGWSWDEILLVTWRIRNGLKTGTILSYPRCQLDQRQLEEFYADLTGRYPFAKIAKRLQTMGYSAGLSEALEGPGLWRRLVFQYRMVEDLPHKQILDRTAEAADLFGFKLNETVLTGWIGLGRLCSQLATFIVKESGG